VMKARAAVAPKAAAVSRFGGWGFNGTYGGVGFWSVDGT
jgi:hypothetical protein